MTPTPYSCTHTYPTRSTGGHEHLYERLHCDGIPCVSSHPPTTCLAILTATTFPATAHLYWLPCCRPCRYRAPLGCRHVVNGLGGRSWDGYGWCPVALTGSMLRTNAQHGAMFADVEGDGANSSMRLRFVGVDGTVLDDVTYYADRCPSVPLTKCACHASAPRPSRVHHKLARAAGFRLQRWRGHASKSIPRAREMTPLLSTSDSSSEAVVRPSSLSVWSASALVISGGAGARRMRCACVLRP